MTYDLSVVIATKRPNLPDLNRAVRSCVIEQALKVEVVIVDDTPGLIGVVGPDDVPNIRVVSGDDRGLAAAVAKGHRLATGEWRIGLDDDDWFERNSLPRLLEAVQGKDTFAYGNVVVDGSLHVTPEWKPGINKGTFKTSYAMLWHSSLYKKAHHYQPDDLPHYFVDYDFAVQVEMLGVRGIKVDIPVLHYLQRPGGEWQKAQPYAAEIRRRINSRYEGVILK